MPLIWKNLHLTRLSAEKKIEKVYEISPTLASIQDSLDAVMDLYAAQSGRIEENKKYGNVEMAGFSGHCVMQFNLKDIIKMGEQQIDFIKRFIMKLK